MRNRCFFHRNWAHRSPHLLLLSLVVVVCAPVLFSPRVLRGAETEPVRQEAPPATRSSFGPSDTGFNSQGFKISKVVRIERSLNALGIAAQFGKTNKVGKYVELPKRLESSERGEHFIITCKCSKEGAGRNAALRFEYKLSGEEHLETITREYPALRKGTYRLQVENTGASYARRGHIEYWRVSIFADGELVAKKESFLWPVFRAEGKTDTDKPE